MSLRELAEALIRDGWTVDQARERLRGTVLECGDFPTCSAVEEAIRDAQQNT